MNWWAVPVNVTLVPHSRNVQAPLLITIKIHIVSHRLCVRLGSNPHKQVQDRLLPLIELSVLEEQMQHLHGDDAPGLQHLHVVGALLVNGDRAS